MEKDSSNQSQIQEGSPLAVGLFTWPSLEPQLLGSHCEHCGAIAFPSASYCQRCGDDRQSVIEIGDKGYLWSWTVQRFLPKSPYQSGETAETFLPYGVGYIAMPSGVKIESRIKLPKNQSLKIGQPMKLIIEVFNTDELGANRLMFAFTADSGDSGEAN